MGIDVTAIEEKARKALSEQGKPDLSTRGLKRRLVISRRTLNCR
jgi:hypothetical protein